MNTRSTVSLAAHGAALLAIFFTLQAISTQPSVPLEQPEPFGTLTGKVLYVGDAPNSHTQTISGYQANECGCTRVPLESLVVDPATHGLKWAVVRIMNVNAPPQFHSDVPTMNLKGCVFTPHVLIVPPATEVKIVKPDKFVTNFHTTPYDSDDPPKNYVLGGDTIVSHYEANWLKEPDIIEITSDVQGWMKGYFVVHDPRYCAVTSDDGQFKIEHIPAGRYTVNIFQESCGEKNIEIEIRPGEVFTINQAFAPGQISVTGVSRMPN